MRSGGGGGGGGGLTITLPKTIVREGAGGGYKNSVFSKTMCLFVSRSKTMIVCISYQKYAPCNTQSMDFIL